MVTWHFLLFLYWPQEGSKDVTGLEKKSVMDKRSTSGHFRIRNFQRVKLNKVRFCISLPQKDTFWLSIFFITQNENKKLNNVHLFPKNLLCPQFGVWKLFSKNSKADPFFFFTQNEEHKLLVVNSHYLLKWNKKYKYQIYCIIVFLFCFCNWSFLLHTF